MMESVMDTNTLINVLHAACGVDPKLLSESISNSRLNKPDAALAGKPQRFPVGGRSLGRCYYEYEEVAVNYGGTDAEKPNGMWRKVEPTKTGVCDGVAWAYFIYEIDSGD
jgi:hypothetical protein